MDGTPHTGAELAARLESAARHCGVDIFGIADLSLVRRMPTGLPNEGAGVLERYGRAIVLGAQHGKLGPEATGAETSLFLEAAAVAVREVSEQARMGSLIVHTEDEFDPARRVGLLSLKVLAKAAGIGWQGRSLLAVSPFYGPLHRLVAVLCDADLPPSEPIANRCGDCTACIDACPMGALTLSRFVDHPASRDEVLDIGQCLGDDGCTVCIEACPVGPGKCPC